MSMFFYVTYKLVQLKDSRLGILYYAMTLLAFLYTLVEIFIKKGYMDFDTSPQGTIKLILSDNFVNETFEAEDLPYCQGDTPCQYLDPWDLNWPIESRAITITTFGKDRLQYRATISNSPRDEYNITEEKVYFTQSPDYVVVKVDHGVVATKFTDESGRERLAASQRQMIGYLVDINGNIMSKFSPEKGKSDRLVVGDLLLAAGVESLDEVADIIDARGRTFRQRGCILKVTISYQNWLSTWVGASDIEYRYHVHRMPYVGYSSKQMTPLMSKEEVLTEVGVHQAQWRLQRKRYAIRVEFVQTGSLAMVSISALIMKLASVAGLLTLIATITDTLALYILPNKNTYREVVYDKSPVLKTLTKTKEKEKDIKQD